MLSIRNIIEETNNSKNYFMILKSIDIFLRDNEIFYNL